LDAVAGGELHRTTGNVLLAFARASDDRLSDPWIAQATVAARLGLGESTVCHHVATAKRLGWVMVQHRNRIDNGLVRAMSNVTRLQLPQHWQDRLAAQQAQRRAEQTRQRRQRNRPGRVTQPNGGERRGSGHGGEHGPVYATAAQQAASTGAARARSASTSTFEQGRAELEAAYTGQPELYEAAYDAFVETWKTVRINE
jgi:TolA-binding protein